MQIERELPVRLGTTFFAKGQPLGAAIILADVASERPRDAGVWTALGASLASSAGVLVRKPFLEAAFRAFERARPLAVGTPYAEVIEEWRPKLAQELGERADLGPMKDEELGPLLDFLYVTPDVVRDAVAGLPEEDRMLAVMAIGERKDERYLSVLLEAVAGAWGPSPARSALKRMGRYRERPELRAAIEKLKERGLGEECRVHYEWLLRGGPAEPAPAGVQSRMQRGLPGGIALPAVLFVLSMTAFAVLWSYPSWVSFGEAIGARISPAGLGVIGAGVTLFWLLVAIAKRPPRTSG